MSNTVRRGARGGRLFLVPFFSLPCASLTLTCDKARAPRRRLKHGVNSSVFCVGLQPKLKSQLRGLNLSACPQTFLRDVSGVSPLALLLFCGDLEVFFLEEKVVLDGWICIQMSATDAALLRWSSVSRSCLLGLRGDV